MAANEPPKALTRDDVTHLFYRARETVDRAGDELLAEVIRNTAGVLQDRMMARGSGWNPQSRLMMRAMEIVAIAMEIEETS